MSVQSAIKRKTAPEIRARACTFPGPEHFYGMKAKA
jgi:hypothetical protein